jgi:hypothetical protein
LVILLLVHQKVLEILNIEHNSCIPSDSSFHKGFVYGDLSKLRATFNNADKGTTASLTDRIEVPVSQGPVHHLRLTAGQEKIIVGLADGQILLFDAKSVATKASQNIDTNET